MNDRIILRIIAVYNFILGIILLFPILLIAAVSSIAAFQSVVNQQNYPVSPFSVVIIGLLGAAALIGVIVLDRGLLRMTNRFRVIEICLCAAQAIVILVFALRAMSTNARGMVFSGVFIIIPCLIITYLLMPSVRSRFTS
jgi:hypothetical protein